MYEKEYFDLETYDQRIANFLIVVKKQNKQANTELAWLESQNKTRKLQNNRNNKTKSKFKKKKEQLQKQVPKLKNVEKFFNFY